MCIRPFLRGSCASGKTATNNIGPKIFPRLFLAGKEKQAGSLRHVFHRQDVIREDGQVCAVYKPRGHPPSARPMSPGLRFWRWRPQTSPPAIRSDPGSGRTRWLRGGGRGARDSEPWLLTARHPRVGQRMRRRPRSQSPFWRWPPGAEGRQGAQ